MIKKHFGKLCDSLPSNYEKTVKKLQQLTDFTEEDRESILPDNQLADPIAVNQRILMYLFMNCQSCDHLMKTCSILEELADPAKQLNVANFHRGKHCNYAAKNIISTYSICMCVPYYSIFMAIALIQSTTITWDLFPELQCCAFFCP